MHWFWRAIISLAMTCSLVALIGGVGKIDHDITEWAFLLSIVLLPFASFVIVSYLTFHQKRFPPPKETRCRKCNYILRGITEPRCPECGEKI